MPTNARKRRQPKLVTHNAYGIPLNLPQVIQRVHALVNRERARQGKPPWDFSRPSKKTRLGHSRWGNRVVPQGKAMAGSAGS